MACATCSGTRSGYRAIIALLDAADPTHARCIAMVGDVGEDLVVLYGHAPWRTFAEDVESGAYRLHRLSPHTLSRAVQIEQQ
jgi:hypothetical protein